jgi:hypothetical protein
MLTPLALPHSPNRTLHVSSIAFHTPAPVVAQQLALSLSTSLRSLLLRVAVSDYSAQGVAEYDALLRPLPPAFAGADAEPTRRPRDLGKHNRGFALLSFSSNGALQAAHEQLSTVLPSLRLQSSAETQSRRLYLREELLAHRQSLDAASAEAEARTLAAQPHRRRRRGREQARDREELCSALRLALGEPDRTEEKSDATEECLEDDTAEYLERRWRAAYSAWADEPSAQALGSLDWAASPFAVDPARGGGLGDTPRALRKRLQVASFAALLRSLPPPPGRPLTVVDFGSGTGNLTLPLAWALPGVRFVAVDGKQTSVNLLEARAQQAGLGNVTALCARIEDCHDLRFDAALGLHVCGSGTDAAMAAATAANAVLCVSPCCIGKTSLGPRSILLQRRLSGSGLKPFALLCAKADFAGDGGCDGYDATSAQGALPRAAKAVVEADRAASAREAGFEVVLTRLLHAEGVGVKRDLLVGWPRGHEARAALVAMFAQPGGRGPQPL